VDQLIARPIGMQDYRPSDGTYFPGPASIHRAYPIRMSARDLARFALLYDRDGVWAGSQIVPSAWVRESTRPYSSSRFGLGYGYLWWTRGLTDPATSGTGTGLPAGTFMAIGAGGQYAFVIPADDLVIVSRVDRDLDLPEPRTSQVVGMVRLILQAGGFAP
jgi:CubicO group peptidase (beta-lactamase class C family)